MSIQSFACKRTQAFFHGKRLAAFAFIQAAAMRKLAMLNAAARLDDLRAPRRTDWRPCTEIARASTASA